MRQNPTTSRATDCPQKVGITLCTTRPAPYGITDLSRCITNNQRAPGCSHAPGADAYLLDLAHGGLLIQEHLCRRHVCWPCQTTPVIARDRPENPAPVSIHNDEHRSSIKGKHRITPNYPKRKQQLDQPLPFSASEYFHAHRYAFAVIRFGY